MSKFKVEFTLKQHTPIIHFQSDQSRATIRATELKPKFDRFLKKYAFDNDFENYKFFLIGYDKTKKQSKKDFAEKEALDYKITVQCTEKISEPIERQTLSFNKDTKKTEPAVNKQTGEPRMSSIPTFFANMGDDWKKNPKEMVWSTNNMITVSILSFEPEILKKIVQHFEEFIFTTNFGMRQSKGFGSFEVISSNSFDFRKSTNFMDFTNVRYKFTIDLQNIAFQKMQAPNVVAASQTFKKLGKLFEILNIFSKTYRSGINQSGYYFKSLMYKYATEVMHVTWDKKYLKSNFLGEKHYEITKQKEDHNNPDILDYTNMPQEYLLRDLLGLSTSQEWMKYKMTIEHTKKDAKSINEVKRYKSPITFKIIDNGDDVFDIYLIIEPVQILSKSFKISCKKSATNTKEITIKTPEKFDIYEYMQFCFSTANLNDHPIKKDKNNNKVNHENDNNHKAIMEIYSQLNQQVVKVIQ